MATSQQGVVQLVPLSRVLIAPKSTELVSSANSHGRRDSAVETLLAWGPATRRSQQQPCLLAQTISSDRSSCRSKQNAVPTPTVVSDPSISTYGNK